MQNVYCLSNTNVRKQEVLIKDGRNKLCPFLVKAATDPAPGFFPWTRDSLLTLNLYYFLLCYPKSCKIYQQRPKPTFCFSLVSLSILSEFRNHLFHRLFSLKIVSLIFPSEKDCCFDNVCNSLGYTWLA